MSCTLRVGVNIFHDLKGPLPDVRHALAFVP
jgi:hypothetical protein